MTFRPFGELYNSTKQKKVCHVENFFVDPGRIGLPFLHCPDNFGGPRENRTLTFLMANEAFYH